MKNQANNVVSLIESLDRSEIYARIKKLAPERAVGHTRTKREVLAGILREIETGSVRQVGPGTFMIEMSPGPTINSALEPASITFDPITTVPKKKRAYNRKPKPAVTKISEARLKEFERVEQVGKMLELTGMPTQRIAGFIALDTDVSREDTEKVLKSLMDFKGALFRGSEKLDAILGEIK